MKKGLLGILAVGMMSSAASAGTLSLRFAGGATEITMDQASQTATLEVVFQMTSTDVAGKNSSRLAGMESRFDVGSATAGDGGNPYIDDGSTKFSVVSVTPRAGWLNNGDAGGQTFNRDSFFLALGGDAAPILGANTAESVIATIVIHKDAFVQGDTLIAFRSGAALPALYVNAGTTWTNRNRAGYTTTDGINQYVMGTGNPGDADPEAPFHGYVAFTPLIIHNVPEPGALALLALGGIAALRRRR
jgi:hypothetical protein